jgi:hypothetical protein
MPRAQAPSLIEGPRLFWAAWQWPQSVCSCWRARCSPKMPCPRGMTTNTKRRCWASSSVTARPISCRWISASRPSTTRYAVGRAAALLPALLRHRPRQGARAPAPGWISIPLWIGSTPALPALRVRAIAEPALEPRRHPLCSSGPVTGMTEERATEWVHSGSVRSLSESPCGWKRANGGADCMAAERPLSWRVRSAER